jgi:hypothetical protein
MLGKLIARTRLKNNSAILENPNRSPSIHFLEYSDLRGRFTVYAELSGNLIDLALLVIEVVLIHT